jgi:hypothetical protein
VAFEGGRVLRIDRDVVTVRAQAIWVKDLERGLTAEVWDLNRAPETPRDDDT